MILFVSYEASNLLKLILYNITLHFIGFLWNWILIEYLNIMKTYDF